VGKAGKGGQGSSTVIWAAFHKGCTLATCPPAKVLRNQAWAQMSLTVLRLTTSCIQLPSLMHYYLPLLFPPSLGAVPAQVQSLVCFPLIDRKSPDHGGEGGKPGRWAHLKLATSPSRTYMEWQKQERTCGEEV
jgi:hypothetical protein